MSIVNISCYKFVPLMDLVGLKEYFLEVCNGLGIKGTILLSEEGINIMLAGSREAIDGLRKVLDGDERFADLVFKESYSEKIPFGKMRIRIKPEIISMRVEGVAPGQGRAKHVTPKEFKKMLDEGQDITVLDTRNTYETKFGTFENAIDLHIDNFRDFPEAANQLDDALKDKPLVMFCTGGVRCEKAAILMEDQGFKEVYQIDGGILKYFEECDGDHWQGDCFVFDERVALNKKLEETAAVQCPQCNKHVTIEEQMSANYVPGERCPFCPEVQKTA